MEILIILFKSLLLTFLIWLALRTSESIILTKSIVLTKIVFFVIGLCSVLLFYKAENSKWIILIACGINYFLRLIKSILLQQKVEKYKSDPINKIINSMSINKEMYIDGTNDDFSVMTSLVKKSFAMSRYFFFGVLIAWLVVY